jgi:predicted  nucleic acid-binding Zn-ribbon protein
MDLYDFINETPKGLNSTLPKAEVPKETVRPPLEQGQAVPTESLETLRQERDSLLREVTALQERLTSMEEELARLRKGSSEFNTLLQTLRSGKEELLTKVRDLESQVQGLEAEGARLKVQLQEAISERDKASEEAQQVREEKDKELQQLKAELSSLSQKVADYEGALQQASQVINSKDFEITQLSQSNVSLQELLKKEEEKVTNMSCEKENLLFHLERIKADFSQYIQKTKMTFAAICIALVIALAGLFIYFGKRPLAEHTRPTEPAPTVKDPTAPPQDASKTDTTSGKEQKAIEETSQAKETGRILATTRPKGAERPESKVTAETKKAKGPEVVEAKPLRAASLSVSGIKVELLPIGKSEAHKLPPTMEFRPEPEKFYYLIAITGGSRRYSVRQKGTIQIDFIDKNNKLASLSDAVKVEQIHHGSKRDKFTRKGYYLVSHSKGFQVKGIVIDKPTKGIKRLIIY